MYNNLPNTTYSFEINATGQDTGSKYDGKFEYKRLTIGEKIKCTAWVAHKLSSDQGMEDTKDVVETNVRYTYYEYLAYMRFGVVSCPQWFIDSDYGCNLEDFNIIHVIHNARSGALKDWYQQIKDKAAEVVVEMPTDDTAK